MILSMQLPVTIFLQIYLTSSKRVMKEYANRPMFKFTLLVVGVMTKPFNGLPIAKTATSPRSNEAEIPRKLAEILQPSGSSRSCLCKGRGLFSYDLAWFCISSRMVDLHSCEAARARCLQI